MRSKTPQPAQPRDRLLRRRGGFTLIEASLTTVIVGTGVLAIVAAQQAYHIKNDYAVRSATGQLLANEVREMTYGLPHHDPVTGAANLGAEAGETAVADYDDLDDFAGVVDAAGDGAGLTISPPVNALGVPLADLDRWQQRVRVGKVIPELLDVVDPLPLNYGADLMRVRVDVVYDTDPDPATEAWLNVATLTWVVPN